MSTPIKVPATVTSIVAHGDDVYSLSLAPMRELPSFLPGQFLHLALDAYEPSSHWPESRVFSIATSPTRASQLRVTFAVKGAFTRRMASTLHEGDVVWLKLPYGDFTLQPASELETVLIAGGTGITPFVAFLEFLLDRRIARPVKLFYGARRQGLLLYRALIDECAARLPGFRAAYWVESREADGDTARCREGRLSLAEILTQVDRPLEAAYYLSGPPPMIKTFAGELSARGVADAHIHIDAWD